MPKHLPPPPEIEGWGEAGMPADGALARGDVYTDGAMSSCLGLARRAGWGVVSLNADNSVEWALHGTLSERFPTVVRAELRAVLEALRRTAGPINIHTDSQEVVDGFTIGETWSTAPRRSGASIWRQIWPLIRELGEEVQILKVKRHTDIDDVSAGRITLREHIGNSQADRAARAGNRAGGS